MRKVIFGLLLAGAAAPALAAGGPRHNNNDDDNSARYERPARANNNNSERSRPSVERSAGGERPVAMQRPQMGGSYERPTQAARPQFDRSQFGAGYQRPERPTQAERPQFNGYERGDRGERAADVQASRPVTRYNPYAGQNRSDAPDSVRNWRPRQSGGFVQPGEVRPGYDGRTGYSPDGRNGYNRDGRAGYNRDGYLGRQNGSYVPRQGTQPPLRVDNRRGDHNRWNTNWRNDRRYDWRDRRRYNSSLFHIGFYSDPFGWDYQPYSVGYRLWPNYYQQNYWIDSNMYGLPFPPPGMQWVRYWNDAVLVDTYSGQVVDSIPGFFW